MYMNPEYLFTYLEGSDVRMSPNNYISYSSNDLKDQIFIGVYGKSMAEYVINVAVKRNSTMNTMI
jgi:hypothetical protein